MADYSYSLQNQILEEIETRSDLRLDVTRVVVDLPGDPAYDNLKTYVEEKIPENVGFLLRVCNLGSTEDYCKLPPLVFYDTMDKDVFVEEVVISAEIGGGEDAEYFPKKVRLFFWEVGLSEEESEDYCIAECYEDFLNCDGDNTVNNICGNNDADECLEIVSQITLETCGAGLCDRGACEGEELDPVFEICSNGTAEGTCISGYMPKYCNSNLYIMDRCSTCGCPDGKACIPHTGRCLISTSKCTDGTSRNYCSASALYGRPYYCDADLNLVNDCVRCGCASDKTCSAASGECEAPAVAELSASYSNLCENCRTKPSCSENRWVYYDMKIEETGGLADAELGSRKRCYYWAESGVSRSSCDHCCPVNFLEKQVNRVNLY